MAWQDIYAAINSLWVVWLLVLFVGIVVWVYWPKRKRSMDDSARIPLRDDDGDGDGAGDRDRDGDKES